MRGSRWAWVGLPQSTKSLNFLRSIFDTLPCIHEQNELLVEINDSMIIPFWKSF